MIYAEAICRGSRGDKLHRFFEEAKDYRDSMPMKMKGSIEPAYEIYVDLIDESGAIATIATILASNRISIKNIGILHNREFQEGVLRIEFYEQRCRRKSHCPAVQVFLHHSYALNKMKYALRSSLVVSIFGKATCRNGLCELFV